MNSTTIKNSSGSGSIRRRPNGTWEARYTAGHTAEGKQLQRSLYAKTRAEISRKLITALSSLENGNYTVHSQITLGEWLGTWLHDYAQPFVRLSTYTNYLGYIENHIRPGLGQIKLKALTPEQIQIFYNSLSERGHNRCPGRPLSPKTLQNLHNVLHQALEKARHNRLVAQNPAENVVLPRQCKKEMRVLSVEEQRRLTAVLYTEPLGFAILLDLSTGLRLGELCGLQWRDINFDTLSFQVRRSIRRVPIPGPISPGAPRTYLSENFPKTENSAREIPIQGTIFTFLLQHRIEQSMAKMNAASNYDDRGYLFAGPYGGIPDPHQIRSVFNRLLLSAEIPYANFHSLRHTFATRAIESGVPIKAVSDILGHTTVRLTMDLYCHSSMELKRSALDQMSGFWSNAILTCAKEQA